MKENSNNYYLYSRFYTYLEIQTDADENTRFYMKAVVMVTLVIYDSVLAESF